MAKTNAAKKPEDEFERGWVDGRCDQDLGLAPNITEPKSGAYWAGYKAAVEGHDLGRPLVVVLDGGGTKAPVSSVPTLWDTLWPKPGTPAWWGIHFTTLAAGLGFLIWALTLVLAGPPH